MSRLQANQPDAATGKANELLDAVQAKLKITPNMTRVMANSPVLEAYLERPVTNVPSLATRCLRAPVVMLFPFRVR